MVRVLIATSVLLTLAACASDRPLPTDVVQDAASAIAIADKACGNEGHWRGTWSAKLQGRVWEARLEGPHDYGSGNRVSTTVRASDGEVSPCEICVTVD